MIEVNLNDTILQLNLHIFQEKYCTRNINKIKYQKDFNLLEIQFLNMHFPLFQLNEFH